MKRAIITIIVLLTGVLFAALNGSLAKSPLTQGSQTNAPKPLRRLPADETTADEIELFNVRFRELKMTAHGPSGWPLEAEPVAGAEYDVETTLIGAGVIATIKFEMVDLANQPIKVIHLNYEDNQNTRSFDGLVEIPKQPFRVRASGKTRRGVSFQNVYEKVFSPQPKPRVIADNSEPESEEIKKFMEMMRRQARAAREKFIAEHPDGVITLPQYEVTQATYEPFLSPGGNPWGMRLKFQVRFSQDGIYSISAGAYPDYEEFDYRGNVRLNVFRFQIDPMPKAPQLPPEFGHQLGDEHLKGLLKNSSPASYQAGVTYRFVIDLLPNYILVDKTEKKFCILASEFDANSMSKNFWSFAKADAKPRPYRVSLDGLDFNARTEGFVTQKTLLEAFAKDGLRECGKDLTNPFQN